MFDFIVGVLTIVVFYKVGKYIYDVMYNVDIFRKKKDRSNQK